MIPFLSQDIQQELVQLAEHYGQPLLYTAQLGTNKRFDPLDKRDRYGEVCMVIRRTNGHLLTMKKTFYPPNGYRLPTGGIHHGEAVLSALLRETTEETGLDVTVKRFLAAVSYQLANTGEVPVFYTFAFLLDEVGGTLAPQDEEERIEGFREIAPQDLPTQAEALASLQDDEHDEIRERWGDWGRFRAVIHRVVWQALS